MFVLLAIVVIITIIYLKLVKPLQYWKTNHVPYLKPWPIFGNMAPVAFRKKHIGEVIQDAYMKFSTHRYFGFFEFSKPALIIRDLALVKKVCISDFDKFTDHVAFFPETSDEFWNKNLFARKGQDWQKMRNILSPAFTSSKMKSMFYLMLECAEEFVCHFKNQPGTTITVEMRDAFTKFSNDVISSCAFGIKCNSLTEPENDFYLMGKRAFDFSGFRSLMFFGSSIHPGIMKLLNVAIVHDTVKNFFRNVVKQTIDYRERTGIIRHDMVHLLRQAQKEALKDGKMNGITDEDITVQAFAFFFAGYDTVAGLLCNLTYELGINFEIQEKLAKEIQDVLYQSKGNVNYTTIMEMKYLDMVISETFRLWPPVTFLNRKSVKRYCILPEREGENPLNLEVGTRIIIPNFAFQRDPQYFPNPEKFDPERFSDENKDSVRNGSFLPFGFGPRFCIANKFAMLEIKVLMFKLLSQFSVVPVEKTAIPMVLKSDSINVESKNGYWLGLKPKGAK